MIKRPKSFNDKVDELFDDLVLPSDTEIRKKTGNARQAEKLTGRKRADQSARMSGEKNSMAGKVHPNRGKSLPQIGRPGVAKPEGFGDKISKARKGVPNLKARGLKRPEQSKKMKAYYQDNPDKKPTVVVQDCPHCGKSVRGAGNFQRWHGNNCKGPVVEFKKVRDWKCIHCNKTGTGMANYKRWHGDNCKAKK